MLTIGTPIYGHNSLDEKYPNVLLLLKGEDPNGSTTFTDWSSYKRVPTGVIATVNTSTQKKWGSGSIYSTGTNISIRYGTSADWSQSQFATNIWCLESWVYMPFGLYGTYNSVEFTFANNGTVPSTPNFNFFPTAMGVYTGNGSFYGTTTAPAAGVWHHCVFQKNTTANTASTSSIDMWLNGVRLNITGGATWKTGTTQPLTVGRNDGAPRPARYLDDFRITMGATRYTPGAATITVPDREYGIAKL